MAVGFVKGTIAVALAGCTLLSIPVFGQLQDPVIDKIVKEETDNSQLQKLAHELFDGIGPPARTPRPLPGKRVSCR